MKTSQHITDIREARWAEPNKTWGLVPTMGALHDGHHSLIEQAHAENDRVGVSIFVNPTQFNDPADLAKYPANLERDLDVLREAGVDLVWHPTPQIVYPPDYQTHITVEEVTKPLEGAARPGHFRGVATVVAKLFNVFEPHRAYFGQKDAQQAVVLKQMVRDLNFNLEIVVGKTIRESDGLAMSSRNANLSPEGRKQAVCLYRALMAAKTAIWQGERDASRLRTKMHRAIVEQPLAEVDYISVAHPETLRELDTIDAAGALLSLAVSVDGVRLIDNMPVEVRA